MQSNHELYDCRGAGYLLLPYSLAILAIGYLPSYDCLVAVGAGL